MKKLIYIILLLLPFCVNAQNENLLITTSTLQTSSGIFPTNQISIIITDAIGTFNLLSPNSPILIGLNYQNCKVNSTSYGSNSLLVAAIKSYMDNVSIINVSSKQSSPVTFTDVNSSAITSNTTVLSNNITNGLGFIVEIPITGVNGTNPTMDVEIQESNDNINWVVVYDFPRATGISFLRSPNLPYIGQYLRYVQTIGGTSPSFTRKINRTTVYAVSDYGMQMIDRTISLNTLSSATPSINTQNVKNLQLSLSLGVATTPPSIQIQGSDDNGITWVNLGTLLTGIANSTVSLTINNINAQLSRAVVTTVGVGASLGYVLLKGF
jgi:hypothetical protein